MTVMTDHRTPPPPPPPKRAYHHGDLRGTLISATRQLLSERGADGFTLSDACRVAGVSTAAPYKHFRDKQEILEEIVARGFDEMGERSERAVAVYGAGTLDVKAAAYPVLSAQLGFVVAYEVLP